MQSTFLFYAIYTIKKKDKFGIKFWLADDVQSKYFLNGFPYFGKIEGRPLMKQLENIQYFA